MKGDERILGDSDFVPEVLKASEEEMERRYRLKAVGFNLEKLAQCVAVIFGMEAEEMRGLGKNARMVPARSVFCYWAAREPGVRETELARRMFPFGVLEVLFLEFFPGIQSLKRKFSTLV